MPANGNGHKKFIQFTRPPNRVVSLVPSLTESLFDLGLGEACVGVTDFCVHPAEAIKDLPRVGGSKNPSIDDIIRLKPDLVLANQEENLLQDVEALEKAGIKVWVSFPKNVRQAVDTLWMLAGIFSSAVAMMRIETLELTLDWAEEAVKSSPKTRYFCPIWQDRTSKGVPWWMSFNQETYAHDVLRVLGGVNLFADRKRRYPLEADLGLAETEDAEGRDTRYPRLSLEEIRRSAPQVVILPNEPFAFNETHIQEFHKLLPETPAAQSDRIRLVDGSLFTWPGTRLARALRELTGIFS